jgi:hypothetical protein
MKMLTEYIKYPTGRINQIQKSIHCWVEEHRKWGDMHKGFLFKKIGAGYTSIIYSLVNACNIS